MNGLMTEREWRRQAARPRPPRPACWGAQCVMPRRRKGVLREDRAFHAFLLLLSLVTAIMLPVLAPGTARSSYPEAQRTQTPLNVQPREVSAVSYALPQGLPMQTVTCTREQLLRGRMLLLDAEHPLPAEAPAPNTFSIAGYGKGMVPVNGLSVKSGRAVIDALAELFQSLRRSGVSGLCVWNGAMSRAEQEQAWIKTARRRSARMTLEQAVRATLGEHSAAAQADMRQEYTVELRFSIGGTDEPDPAPLESTAEGRTLLRQAWRSGFIRREPQGEGAAAFRFRYVGKAHATAMTYLDLSLEDYLEWLHHKGTLAVEQEGRLKYVILCRPLAGTHVAFDVPEGADVELSADNDGYALAACTLDP